MGGLALAHLGTVRYETKEFIELSNELLPKIRKIFNTDAKLVTFYRNKESHGDMDILLLHQGQSEMNNIKELIIENFKPRDTYFNGNCYSFDYKNFQIDLIVTPLRNWETAQIFFSYNDLGNLMGKIFHKFGLKYGFDGVKYVYRMNDKKLGEFVVTKDMSKAFEFIGLSWDRYLQGFDKLEDIFDYVISSKYFNPEEFKLENLNAINRKRNNRRKVYNQFVEYVKDMNSKYLFNKDKSTYIDLIHEKFSECNFKQRLEEFRKKEFKRREIVSKFNGKLIMNWFPELNGPSLGKIIGSFKSLHDEEYFLVNDATKIEEDFKNYYNKQKS